jgi:hypothetical protein
MTPDQYALALLDKYTPPTGLKNKALLAPKYLRPLLDQFAPYHLHDIVLSGSFAKQTALAGNADLDLLLSLKPDTPGSMKQIFRNLFDFLADARLNPRPQNVSIGINVDNLHIDLIPARQQDDTSGDHTLFKHHDQSWTKTNIQSHIDLILSSGRQTDIKLLKIWKKCHALVFPSFYLELAVLNALAGQPHDRPVQNFLTVLEYLRDRFTSEKIPDPGNPSNLISDDLTDSEKSGLATIAKFTRAAPSLESMLW